MRIFEKFRRKAMAPAEDTISYRGVEYSYNPSTKTFYVKRQGIGVEKPDPVSAESVPERIRIYFQYKPPNSARRDPEFNFSKYA
ncbi:MAG: hypothetical protein HY514_04265 [Candidatus Aenigmarchaeota archaeon]|nr:hypothetical protein [Candidatus Aenigmarchaeota archaeon]